MQALVRKVEAEDQLLLEQQQLREDMQALVQKVEIEKA